VTFGGIEHFTITTGSGADNIVTGDGDDVINTGEGDDFLSGGFGSNTLIGGPGNDTYLVLSPTDVVTESIGEGNDLIYVAVSGYTLAANVETLWLTGAAASGLGNNASGNTLVGNAFLNSTITGGTGADLLVGVHTASKTTMAGGAGDDTYVTFNSTDDIQENAAGGRDTIYAAADFTLPANVEILWLIGNATHGTGNANGGTLVANNNVASTITGGSGLDLLVGAHNVTSTLAGAGGDDTYVVFNSGDTVQEASGDGNDALYATTDFVLPANVETLWLIGAATHATSNGSGGTLVANNNLDSTLTGASASDLLVGGHASVSTMIGGDGNDTYVTFNTSDVIQETASGGSNDALVTYVSHTIPDNVETMFLGTDAGPINGTGGNGADTIIGNAFDNVLDGDANRDVLVGAGGADTFVFKAGEAVGDVVTDFTSGQDHLKFVGYGAGTLTQIDATHWQINSANGLTHDTITLNNAPSIQPNDVLFV
jgi:Ca2+-binding RTX toxin-like protein